MALFRAGLQLQLMSGSWWQQVWDVCGSHQVCLFVLIKFPSTLDLSKLGDDVMLDQTCHCSPECGCAFIFRPELQVQIST